MSSSAVLGEVPDVYDRNEAVPTVDPSLVDEEGEVLMSRFG
jgi:hypothetical protein